jgi:hypothetical protein
VNGCAWTFVLLIAGLALFAYLGSVERERARRAYRAALDALKRDPASPSRREEALRRGRDYANLMRNWRGRSLFDEVALMNDINAACAAASVQRPLPSAQPSASIEDRLTRLHDLKTRGLITEAEYDTRRREILRDT